MTDNNAMLKAEHDGFIAPTAEELTKEYRITGMTKTEQELCELRFLHKKECTTADNSVKAEAEDERGLFPYSLFSSEYARFIMPTAAELAEERRIADMSRTEQELYELRVQMLDGKLPRLSDHIGGRTCYEDAVDCTLFWAVEGGEITQEESDRLYSKYVG